MTGLRARREFRALGWFLVSLFRFIRDPKHEYFSEGLKANPEYEIYLEMFPPNTSSRSGG